MVHPDLKNLEGLGLIVNTDKGVTIVPRDRAWLNERGLLEYDKLPLSVYAIAANNSPDAYNHRSSSVDAIAANNAFGACGPLLLSVGAGAKNTGKDPMVVRIYDPEASGVEISREKYDELLNMPYQKGDEGLRSLFKASDEAEKISPTGEHLTPAMSEVCIRLGNLFPDKSDSWRKAETYLYFGHTVR